MTSWSVSRGLSLRQAQKLAGTRYAMGYVITVVTDCQMHLENLDGQVLNVLVHAGVACRRDAGVQHNVLNTGAVPMVFVEVEIKAQG